MKLPEDLFTTTVSAAAAYEGWRAESDPESWDDEDYYDGYDVENDDHEEENTAQGGCGGCGIGGCCDCRGY